VHPGRGNTLLPAFIADYNTRFAKPPVNKKDLHRPLRAGDDLEDAFAWTEERTVSQALTLQYDKVIFILEPTEQAKAAIGKRVTVADYPDGRLAIRYNGVELAYRTFDKLRQVDQRAIADNKRLGPVLAMIRDAQMRRGPQRRSVPRRRDQRDIRLFKVGGCSLGRQAVRLRSSRQSAAEE
jgi:plasmid stabilization system protein ParE